MTVAALPTQAPSEVPAAARTVDGAAFILDAPERVPVIHGDDREVLWAAGEPLLIVAPPGVGKTTLAGQLVRGRLALGEGVLGYPIQPGRQRVLYIAADRPRQIARAHRRIFTEADRDVLAERLIVWRGPLPFDLGREPEQLAAFAIAHGADTLVIDSLKDVALDLSKDETGARVNAAWQSAIAEGVEVVSLHHQRKASAANPKPRTLSDVYGSMWLTAGAGSVVLLWGEPGDPILDLAQLKTPIGEGVTARVLVDHDAGTIERQDDLDPGVLLARAGTLTAPDAARLLYEVEKPSRAQVEKARRHLERLFKAGIADRGEDSTGAVTYSHNDVTETVTRGSRA